MLLSDVHLSDVCLSHTSGLSREQRPRKTKIGTEVAHVTRDSNTTFSVKRLRSPGRFGWLFKSLHNVHRWDQSLCHCPEWAAGCRSWIFMVQGALGAAGVKCVGYGWRWATVCVQWVGRGHIVSPRLLLFIIQMLVSGTIMLTFCHPNNKYTITQINQYILN